MARAVPGVRAAPARFRAGAAARRRRQRGQDLAGAQARRLPRAAAARAPGASCPATPGTIESGPSAGAGRRDRSGARTGVCLADPASQPHQGRQVGASRQARADRPAGLDRMPLLTAQRERLVPVAAALRARLAHETGFDRTVALWRSETVEATLRFLDAMRASDAPGADRTAG